MNHLLKTALFFACITALLNITACKSIGEDNTENSLEIRYQCDDNSTLMVSFNQNKMSATINFGLKSQTELPMNRVASGFLYEDMYYSFRGKGNEAIWRIGRESSVKCRATN